MSLFQRLGITFGIGSVKVAIGLAEPVQFRTAPFHGAVLLEGGAAEITLMMLTVDLNEFWVTGRGKNRTQHFRHHGRVTLAENLNVEPEYRCEYPFEMALPEAARCSRRREGWTVDASAHIAMAVDARSHALLKVAPPPEVLAIQRAVRDHLGFTPVGWDGSQREIFYDFVSPPHLKDRLDGIGLRLSVVNDNVRGEVILNRQERSMSDYLNVLVGGDKEVLPFDIPRSEVLSKRGTPNPAGADRFLRDVLAQAGIAL